MKENLDRKIIKECLKLFIPVFGDIYLHKSISKVINSEDKHYYNKFTLRFAECVFYFGKYSIYGISGWLAYLFTK